MKNWFLNQTLIKKQIIVFLAVGLIPLAVASEIALSIASGYLKEQAFNNLDAIRKIKASAIERYFSNVDSQITTMADSPAIVHAMSVFARGFQRIPRAEKFDADRMPEIKAALRNYYDNEFDKKYQVENDGEKADIDALINGLDEQALAAQYLYISQNSHPLGEKHRLDRAQGRSLYHSAHETTHPGIREFLEEFGYYDIFLIDPDNGDIVYSVFKELDYGTSLIDGPYANTNFAEAFERARNLPKGKTVIVDFASYVPSYNAPASFIATPIYREDKRIGVLAFQIPIEPINTIMSTRAGLGKTGQSYLIGEDFLRRSIGSRHAQPETVANSFRHSSTSSVKTEASKMALQGQEDHIMITNIDGEKTLSSFNTLQIKDFRWAIISEISKSEAFAAITALNWAIAIVFIFSAGLIFAAAIGISRLLSAPIIALGTFIQKVEHEGNFNLSSDNTYRDEVGTTSRAFSQLLNNLSRTIGATNAALDELGQGREATILDDNLPGQLQSLAQGVNIANRQIQEARHAQQQQQHIAEQKSLEAQEKTKEAEQQAQETLIIKQALDVSATAVMIADADFNIIYQNTSSTDLMHNSENDFKQELPEFNADTIIGKNIDIFHKNPAHQRRLIRDLSESYTAKINISSLTFSLSTTPIRDTKNTFLGAVVEWVDQTQILAKRREEKRIANENARIRQALDNASTGTLISDQNYRIIYQNNAMQDLLQAKEIDLKNIVTSFDSNLMNQPLTQLLPQIKQQTAHASHKAEIVSGNTTLTYTASPITTRDNERIGTVVEWIDRSNEVAIEKEIDTLIESASQGDFSQVLDTHNKEGFFARLSHGLNTLLHTTNIALDDILRVFSALATGNLSEKIDREYQGEFATLKTDANATVDKLNNIIGEISTRAASIARGAAEISSGNTDLSQRTEEQASSLEETASSMEEMTTVVKHSEANARQANSLAERSVAIAHEGDISVQKTAQAMNEIAQASSKIANIIGVIDEIAFQTNLLALNAAVEAARAGEQGRGFAVVATEVRNLAQRSAGAAKEIKDLINDSVNKVSEGSSLVEDSGQKLRAIVTEIEQMNSQMEGIVTSAREQSLGIQQVNTAVSQMDQMTQENGALVEQATAASESMAEQAQKLDQIVAFFRTSKIAG